FGVCVRRRVRPPLVSPLFPYTTLFRSYGACPECTGLGQRLEVDPELVVPDEELTLSEGAIAPWAMGHSDRHLEVMAGLAQELSLDRKSTRLNSSHVKISYAVFCLKKKR